MGKRQFTAETWPDHFVIYATKSSIIVYAKRERMTFLPSIIETLVLKQIVCYILNPAPEQLKAGEEIIRAYSNRGSVIGAERLAKIKKYRKACSYPEYSAETIEAVIDIYKSLDKRANDFLQSRGRLKIKHESSN